MKTTRLLFILVAVLLAAWAVAQSVSSTLTARVDSNLNFTLTSSNLTVSGGGMTLVLAPPAAPVAVDTNGIVAAVLGKLTNGAASVMLTGRVESLKFNP